MKKQASEEVAPRIDDYLVENNTTAIKLREAQSLPSGDIAIPTLVKDSLRYSQTVNELDAQVYSLIGAIKQQ